MSAIVIIGISGGIASGKTSIANIIKNRYPDDVVIIPIEYFYFPVYPRPQEYNWDVPEALDTDLLFRVLTTLKRGKSQWIPKYDLNSCTRITNAVFIEPKKVVIVEGLYSFYHSPIINMVDIKVYVKCDHDSALTRRIRSDMANKYCMSLDDTLLNYEKHVKPTYDNYISKQEKTANLIFHNSCALEKLKTAKFIDLICTAMFM